MPNKKTASRTLTYTYDQAGRLIAEKQTVRLSSTEEWTWQHRQNLNELGQRTQRTTTAPSPP